MVGCVDRERQQQTPNSGVANELQILGFAQPLIAADQHPDFQRDLTSPKACWRTLPSSIPTSRKLSGKSNLSLDCVAGLKEVTTEQNLDNHNIPETRRDYRVSRMVEVYIYQIITICCHLAD